MVRKDGRILVIYENVGELVETHLKGLELKKEDNKKRRNRLRKQKDLGRISGNSYMPSQLS